jgi:polar amino acid transport system substrate-binding protein
VRWTEGRNMQAFLESIARGRTKATELITHRFPIADAEDAYRIVSGERQEPHIGIVLTYPEDIQRQQSITLKPVAVQAKAGAVRISFAGAGSFARSYLLPHLKDKPGVELVSVATAKGYTAVDAAKKFGFAEAAGDAAAICDDPRVDAVFVATRHDHHAPLALRALAAGKHVFVEKPLSIDLAGLAALLPVAEASGKIVQTGFNRRFSPLAVKLREVLAGSAAPVQITYRVNAGPLPLDHWLLHPEQGGGRMIGEGCHFIDLMQFLTGDTPARVTATRFGDDATGSMTALVEFSGGSVGVLVYQANASPSVAKERVEAFSGGRGGVLDDWRSVDLMDGRKTKKVSASGQAKGYAEEIAAFLGAIKSGQPAISLQSQALTTLCTLAAIESWTTRRPVDVTLPPRS